MRKWMDLYIGRIIDPYMDFWFDHGAYLPWWIWLFFWPVLGPLAIAGFLIIGVCIWVPLVVAPALVVLVMLFALGVLGVL